MTQAQQELLDAIKQPDAQLTPEIFEAAYEVMTADEDDFFNAFWLRALDGSGIPDACEIWEEYCNARERQEKDTEEKRKVVCDAGTARLLKPPDFQPIEAYTAEALSKMDIPPVEFLVEKILPKGLSLIAAPPKSYKSYAMLHLCLSICTGGKFLGFQCKKSACLYLDLESSPRRPRDRLRQILKDKTPPGNLFIITATQGNVGKLDGTFQTQMEFQLQEHPEIEFVVIDVLQMLRLPGKRGQTLYSQDYDDFSQLKKIADNHNIGIMVVSHSRKMKDSGDIFNEISGSTGTLGSLDCCWYLSKQKRSDKESILNITGRDIVSAELSLMFNQQKFIWENHGTAEDVAAQKQLEKFRQSNIAKTVQKLVNQNGGSWSGTVSDIRQASTFLGTPVFESPQKIGMFLGDSEGFFWAECGISYEVRRTGKAREYVFTRV